MIYLLILLYFISIMLYPYICNLFTFLQYFIISIFLFIKEYFILSRKPRELSPTNIYHVVIRGADRQILFEEKTDYQKYLHILEYYKSECNFELYAYCLMSNHIHLIIHINDIPLSSVFRRINTSYAVWFNMKYQRTGFLQQGRYYSEPIFDDRHLLNALCYIHYNPLKAGLEDECGTSYKWSSFHDYHRKKSLTDTNHVLKIIGGIEAFFDLHHNYNYKAAKWLDIDTIRIRLPDDVARDIIFETCNCNTVADFQKLSITQRNDFIILLHKKGISIRQLNRLTGVPRGIVERIIKKGQLSQPKI